MQAYHSYPPRYCGTSPLYPEYDSRLIYMLDDTHDGAPVNALDISLDVTPANTLDDTRDIAPANTPDDTPNVIQAAPLPRHLRWCRWGR